MGVKWLKRRGFEKGCFTIYKICILKMAVLVYEDEWVFHRSCVNCYKHDKCSGHTMDWDWASCWGPRDIVYVWDSEKVS